MPMAPNTTTTLRRGVDPTSRADLKPQDVDRAATATATAPSSATAAHRVRSMPQLKVTRSESALIAGLSGFSSPAPDSFSSSRSHHSHSFGFDRALFHRLDDVTAELARLQRLSDDLPQHREQAQVQAELRRMQHHSRRAVQQQKDLMDKIDRQEQSALRRYFSFGKEQKVESLKAKLWERMSESVDVDTQLQRLERESLSVSSSSMSMSMSMAESMSTIPRSTATMTSISESFSDPYACSFDASTLDASDAEAEEPNVAAQIALLEQEREALITSLLSATHAPEAQQLHARIAMYVSETRASQSILTQVDKCAGMYRQALLLLQSALASMNLPEYAGQLKEFVTGPYCQAVDAGHLMETAAFVVQPEARRRYRDRTGELLTVRWPKFPQAIVDFAKRARVNYDRKSSLSLEASRKLRAGESVVVLLHRLAIQKLQVLNQWRDDVENDLKRSRSAHDRLAARLQEKMLVMARSASA